MDNAEWQNPGLRAQSQGKVHIPGVAGDSLRGLALSN